MVLLPLTVLLVRVNVPLFMMPPPQPVVATRIVPAHRAVGKTQYAAVGDAAAAVDPLSIANGHSTDAHCDSEVNGQDSATLIAIDDRGRGSTAGDGEIAGDSEFIRKGQEVGVWRQDDRVVPCPQSVGLLNRCTQRADAVSRCCLAHGVAGVCVRSIEWTVNGEGRCLGEGPANKAADENAKIPCSPENSVLAH